MDRGTTFGANNGLRITVYAVDEVAMPELMTFEVDGRPTEFHRLSDRAFRCPKEGGGCGSADCHSRVSAECRCGVHGQVRPWQAKPGSWE